MVLTAHGLTLALRDTPFGPLVAPQTGELRPLELILNQAATGDFPELADALARGTEAGTPYYLIRRPDPRDDVAAARERWRERTGGELGDDAYVLAVDFYDERPMIPRAVLRDLLDELRRRRADAPKPPGPWLFRPDPMADEPAPGEGEWLRQLEREAAELDALDAVAAAPVATAEAIVTTLVQRRNLLVELDAAGILIDGFAEQKAAWLDRWGLVVLATYARAAEALHRYFRSAERRQYVPGAGPERILGATVSIDWFRRRQPAPVGVTPFAWCAHAERELRDAGTLDGGIGGIFSRVGSEWWLVHWRRDDGKTPAVASAARERPTPNGPLG